MNYWQHGKQDDSDEGRKKKMNSKRPGIVSGRVAHNRLNGMFIGGVNRSAPMAKGPRPNPYRPLPRM